MTLFMQIPYIFDAFLPQPDASKRLHTFSSSMQVGIPVLPIEQVPLACTVDDGEVLEHLRYHDGKLWLAVGPLSVEGYPLTPADVLKTSLETNTEISPYYRASAAGSEAQPPAKFPSQSDWMDNEGVSELPAGYQDRRAETVAAIEAVELIAVQEEDGKTYLWVPSGLPYYEIRGNDSTGYTLQVRLDSNTRYLPKEAWSATQRDSALTAFKAKMERLGEPDIDLDDCGNIQVLLPDLKLWGELVLVRNTRPAGLDFRA